MVTTAPVAAPAARRTRPAARRPPARAGIFGLGAALPERVVTNDDIALRLDTSDEWIVKRTGIRTRYWLEPGEALAPLAAEACAAALADAGREPAEVDRIIVATTTPDRVMPGLAPQVAELVGCPTSTGALDLNAACAGFTYALDEAAALVESGRAGVVLVCGADAMSRVIDRDDRGTAVLFGDGAGAVVVCGGDLEVGIAGFVHGSDPSQGDALYVERDECKLRMEGPTVYRHAIARMVEATVEALDRARLDVGDIDLLVAHQANSRIIEATAAELGLHPDRVVLDVERCANTSSATIPLALQRAEADGLLHPDANILMAAFGAGFVWSAGVVRWKERVHVCA
jgi:3-oxoacyl-[acyl-carrier-protein] synthase-3